MLIEKYFWYEIWVFLRGVSRSGKDRTVKVGLHSTCKRNTDLCMNSSTSVIWQSLFQDFSTLSPSVHSTSWIQVIKPCPAPGRGSLRISNYLANSSGKFEADVKCNVETLNRVLDYSCKQGTNDFRALAGFHSSVLCWLLTFWI